MNSDVMDRIWARVTADDNGCWIYASNHPDGYGRVRVGKRSRAAHLLTYEQMIGDIPDGLQLDHLCRNRSCVNPYHLDPVTQSVNSLRSPIVGRANSRKTHCKRGHEFTPENTGYAKQSGGRGIARRCRTCARDASRERRVS